MTTFIKAVAEKGAEIQLIEAGYFCIPQAETAMDRGLVELRKECYFGIPQAETAMDRGLVELRKECVKLRAENNRLTAAIDAISGTIAIYRAHQP